MSIDLDVIESKVFFELEERYSDDFEELFSQIDDRSLYFTNFSGRLHRLYDFIEDFEYVEDSQLNNYVSCVTATVDQILNVYHRLSTDEEIVQKWSTLVEKLSDFEDSTKIVFIYI